MFDAKIEATCIIIDYTIQHLFEAGAYEPENSEELRKTMTSSFAYELYCKLTDKELTPMEYNSVCNELQKILNNIFE